MKLDTLIAAVAAVLAASPAAAVTYTGTLAAGTAFVDLTFVTDGTIGSLTLANLTGWSGTITQGSNSAVFGSDLPGVFTSVAANGTGLTASSTQISFSPGNFTGIVLGNDNAGVFPVFCLVGVGINCGGGQSRISASLNFNAGNFGSTPLSGPIVVATAVQDVVPEPAAWGLMIAGFGLTGAALRRRAAKVATA